MIDSSIDYVSRITAGTLRDAPHDEESANARLLIRAGYVSKVAAGIYALLPLGLRTLRKIEGIIREEMTALGASETLLPALHPSALWETTGRRETVDVLFSTQSRGGSVFCLGPTHEEVVTPVVQRLVASYRDLPCAVYQIQTKFRDEPRSRSGLLRGREFRMKDLYSFHLDTEDMDRFYAAATTTYHRIFERLGIGDRTVETFASGGAFSRFSHEFQLLADAGEDTIFVTPDRRRAINKEISEDAHALRQVFGDSIPALEEHRAIEVGNIFRLGTRFSDAFGFTVPDSSGTARPVIMGCFGIGTTRLLGAIAEVLHDDRGLRWPRSCAPYDAHVLVLVGSEAAEAVLARVIETAKASGRSLLIDNRRDKRAGEKFADADLIGIPERMIIGKRAVESGVVEVERR